MKSFAELTEREILAVAIFAEEEDSRIYMSFAEDLAQRFPDSAKIFEEMAGEEKAPWHFKLLVAAAVVYLTWRLLQLVGLLG